MTREQITTAFALRVLVAGAFFWALWHSRETATEPTTLAASEYLQSRDSDSQQSITSESAFYHSQFIEQAEVDSVHSATITTTQDDQLVAFWFGGSREGAADVAIYQSYFTANHSGGSWTQPQQAFTRATLSSQLGRHLTKLGNPVAFSDSSGRLWLFLVSVSVGGWSGSAVNYTISVDKGTSWSRFGRLAASPLLNLGTLVRNPPLELADGGLLLPAYHETITKYPQVIRLNEQGTIVANKKIGGAQSIQPSLCPSDGHTIYSLARNVQKQTSGRRILISSSEDSGAQWSRARETNLENPHAAVVCLQIGADQWMLIANRSEIDRSRLSLALSRSPTKQWQWLHDFENTADGRFSYPAITEDKQGRFHLLYTWNRQRIRHIQFNRAWLERIRSQHDSSTISQ